MRYTISVMLIVSGCVAGGPPDHPLTATWQGEKALELSAAGYRFGDEFGSWSVDKRTLRLLKNNTADPTARKGEERCNYSVNGRVLTVSDCRFAGRYVRAG
jgi:hypothetical protein